MLLVSLLIIVIRYDTSVILSHSITFFNVLRSLQVQTVLVVYKTGTLVQSQ